MKASLEDSTRQLDWPLHLYKGHLSRHIFQSADDIVILLQLNDGCDVQRANSPGVHFGAGDRIAVVPALEVVNPAIVGGDDVECGPGRADQGAGVVLTDESDSLRFCN